MGQPITSRVTIKVDGEIILNRSGFTFRKGGIQRTSVTGDGGVHGYTEEQMPSRLHGNVTDNEKSDIDDHDIGDATILIETNSGKSYVMSGAWRVDMPEVDIGAGQYSVAFEGPAAERM